MTTRIDARFAALAKQGRSAFVTFVTAGDPDLKTSLDVIKALPKAGADIIELGMPFTDPMADGPSIQLAGQRALKAGITVDATFEMVRRYRKETAERRDVRRQSSTVVTTPDGPIDLLDLAPDDGFQQHDGRPEFQQENDLLELVQ